VVPTHNRSGLLRETLSRLAFGQRGCSRFEVVVVDNNSTDDTRRLVESFASGRVPVHYVFEPRQGASFARNAGAMKASAPLLAFLDDDLDASPEWVSQICATMARHPQVVCLGGAILPEWECTPPDWLSHEHWSPLAILDLGTEPFVVDPKRPICLMSGNMACRAEFFHAVGGFDPSLRRSEDRDLTVRLLEAGFTCMYAPHVVVSSRITRGRMTKSYHRRWHRVHGRFLAIMDDRRPVPSRMMVLGVPGYLLRQSVEHLTAWVREQFFGSASRAFFHETRLHFCAGFIGQRLGIGREQISAEVIGERRVFSRSLSPPTFHP
jgi:glycosyltransferase involved in cell wall biosynthesis